MSKKDKSGSNGQASTFTRVVEGHTCSICERPVNEWPMAFRGDAECSIVCKKKAAHERADLAPELPEVQMGADE